MGPAKAPARREGQVRLVQLRYAILLGLSMFGWLNKNDARYIDHVKAELKQCSEVVANYQHNPPKHSSADQDELYITRAELDISIVEGQLARYQKHHASRAIVEATLRQLERDLEDRPVLDDDRPTV